MHVFSNNYIVPSALMGIDNIHELQGTSIANCNNFLQLQNNKLICSKDNFPINQTATNDTTSYKISFGNYINKIDPLNQFVLFSVHFHPPLKLLLLNMT